MGLTFYQLKAKMQELTAFMLTQPISQDDRATEVWIKFRNDGFYVYINFEQPLPTIIVTQKLVGGGNALNCNESKKDDITQYSSKSEIIDILESSQDFKGNINATVLKIKELISVFKTNNILHG